MGILLLFAIGGAFGYVSHLWRPMTPPRLLLDVAVAIIAALFGGLSLAPQLGFRSTGWGTPNAASLLVASGAALIAISVLYGVRRMVLRSV